RTTKNFGLTIFLLISLMKTATSSPQVGQDRLVRQLPLTPRLVEAAQPGLPPPPHTPRPRPKLVRVPGAQALVQEALLGEVATGDAARSDSLCSLRFLTREASFPRAM